MPMEKAAERYPQEVEKFYGKAVGKIRHACGDSRTERNGGSSGERRKCGAESCGDIEARIVDKLDAFYFGLRTPS